MRLRSVCAVLVTALVGALVTAAPAYAGTVVVRSGGVFGPWQMGGGTYAKGPGSPPGGVGSLHLTRTGAVLQFPAHVVGSALTALSARIWQPVANPPGVVWVLSIDFTDNATIDGRLRTTTTAAGWHIADVLSQPLTATDSADSNPTATTWTDYLTAHPDLVILGLGLANEISPPDEGGWAVDLLSFGVTGNNTTTYDFEPLRSTVAFPAPRSPIAKGHAVTLTAKVTGGDSSLPDARVQLWSRPSGAAQFTKVTTTSTGATGIARVVLTPRRTTAYQWRFAGDATHIGSESAKRKVVVTG
ncbi:MAG: hypothetical protein QOH89_1639 [Pseudonocardiales bacterium]|nr:hypothetical protein [Pseudonocardiales bacterium]